MKQSYDANGTLELPETAVRITIEQQSSPAVSIPVRYGQPHA